MAQFFTDFSGASDTVIPGFEIVLPGTYKIMPWGGRIHICAFNTTFTNTGLTYSKSSYSDRVNLFMKAVNKGPTDGGVEFPNSGVDFMARVPNLPATSFSDSSYSAINLGFGHSVGKSFIRQWLNGVSSINAENSGGITDPFIGVLSPREVNYRADCNGTTVSLKNWLSGDSEPASYAQSATVSHTDTGRVGFRFADPLSVFEIIAFGIGTDGDLAPTAPTPRVVSGTVAGDLERDIYVYAFETGMLLGKTRSDATGAFSFNVNNDFIDKVRVICVDEGVEPKNSLIYDRVIPV